MTRRIVTGTNIDGRSRVLSDSPAFEFGTLTELWATESAPASYGSDDEVAGRQVRLEPPAGPLSHTAEEPCLPPDSLGIQALLWSSAQARASRSLGVSVTISCHRLQGSSQKNERRLE